MYCIVNVARRPADPVKSCPCFILRRLLPRASYLDISFCAPIGALRSSARLIGGGWLYSESMILSRIDILLPHYFRLAGATMGGRLVGGHPDTRGELTIWTSFDPISAAERTGCLPWVSLEVRGWLAERQQSIWDTRMRQKRVPLARKCVKNANP